MEQREAAAREERLPTTPTRAMPGSRTKVEILAARAIRGEELWHEDDANFGP